MTRDENYTPATEVFDNMTEQKHWDVNIKTSNSLRNAIHRRALVHVHFSPGLEIEALVGSLERDMVPPSRCMRRAIVRVLQRVQGLHGVGNHCAMKRVGCELHQPSSSAGDSDIHCPT